MRHDAPFDRRFPMRRILWAAFLFPVSAFGVAVLFFLVVQGGPFRRGTYDNRAEERVAIVAVTEKETEATVELSDGRVVRLAELGSDRRRSVSRYVGKEATIVGDPANPLTVELLVWIPISRCGLAYATWSPFARRYPRYRCYAVAAGATVARWGGSDPERFLASLRRTGK